MDGEYQDFEEMTINKSLSGIVCGHFKHKM